ncbi:MAG: hypothetical protein QM617_06975 [Comamonas sp.]
MSAATPTASGPPPGPQGFEVKRVFHPTIQVPDLAQAEQWFERVFGRPSTSLTTIIPSTPQYPTEYSTFTAIRDVLFDSIDPKLHFINGHQRYPAVQQPSLKGLGWYVEGMEALYHALRRNGIRSLDLADNVSDGDEPPQSPGGGVVTFFVAPDDAGLQYQFFREGPFPLDPRVAPGWTLGPVEAGDPLGLLRSSHHTLLTLQPERALRFAVAALGGRVAHRGRNALIGADSTFVELAGEVFEYAVPDAGTPAHAELAAQAPRDVYHGLTWRVEDLGRVARHLDSVGVAIGARTADTLVTRPDTSLGIPWGFTTAPSAAASVAGAAEVIHG